MKMKRIAALLLCLVMVLSLAACGKKEDNKGGVTEVKDVKVPEFKTKILGVKVTNEDMASYPLYKATASTVNSQGTAKTTEYVGYKFSDVLKACKISDVPKSVVVTATDGYSFTYEGDLSAETMLIAITKNGKDFTDGLWFAPCASGTTGDFLENLKNIELPGSGKQEEEKKDDPAGPGELKDPDVQDKTGKIDFAPFSFKVDGKEVKNETLKDVKIYKAKVTVQNSKGNISEVSYSGYVLRDVLEALGIKDAKTVKVVAADGYESEISAENLASEISLIAIEKDKAIGENGTVWFAPCMETSSGKYAKEVVEFKTK